MLAESTTCVAALLRSPPMVLQNDLPLLLSSAAALPVLWQCGLITVYRCTHQCGERSNAAVGRQSAAVLPSLAPHDSKARLQDVTICRRFMAKPCTPHPHCAARAVIRATNCQCRGSRGSPLVLSLGGVRGIFSFREREYPPFPRPPHGVGPEAALPRCTPCALRAQKETALAGCFPPAPEARKLSKLSIWDTYPHFPPFSLDNMRY